MWGSGFLIRSGGVIGNLLSIEGRAIRRAHQANGLGMLSLKKLIAEEDYVAMASVTRNPAIIKLMRKAFYTVLPDLTDADPLHPMQDKVVRHLVNVYGRHVGADPRDLPFVHGRYKGGLYGYADPGKGLEGLPQIAGSPESGIVMIAMDEAKLI